MKQFFSKEDDLVLLLDKYKEQLDFKSKNYEEIEAYVENKPLVISTKIDGVLNAVKYLDGKTYLATREGRITEELPVTEEISKLLTGKQETILFGELYGVDADGKELPLNETVSITRKLKSSEDENRIKFGIFDIYRYDGKLVEENDYWKRLLLVQELFEDGKYVHPVYAKNEDGSSAIKKMWEEEVLREGHEGVVLHIEGDTIKIKPTKTVDCLVIAIKPNLEKGFASSLFLALMDKDGIFRSTSFVGTGLKEEERVEWLNYAKENKALAPNHDDLIWVDINKNPRIVEVDYERPIVKKTESFEFTNGEWKQLEEERLSATLIKPRFIRLREDKKVNENDLRFIQISDLEKELTKKSFKINAISSAEDYEAYYKEKHNSLPNWHYNYMDRFVEDKPLAVYLDVISEKETPTTRSILFDYLLNNLDKFKNRIINVDELLNDIELVKNSGVNKVFRVYPRGNVILNKEIKSFKLQAYYPKHPNTIIFPKSEFVRYPLSEASVWSYYDKVKDKIIQQTRGKNVLLYLRVNGDILKRKHDGIVKIDNYNDFNRINNGRMVEIHVEACQEKRDTCLTDIIFCDVDPKETFPWKETKEITKKIYNIFNKDSNVKKVTIKYSGGRGFHIFGYLRESWEVDRAREYTKRLLKSLESDRIKLGVVRELDMLRLDTTLLKRRGSLRAAYSLNKTTGLVAVPVDIKALDSFEKKDATIKKVLEKLNISKKSFKVQSEDNPYSNVVSGLWAIWQDDVEAATAHGLYHESWFPTIGFPDKGTILGRSLYDKVTRGRFMIVNGAMQVRIYKNAGNPEEALDKSDRLLNKIGHKGEYNSVQFWIEDERSSSRVATKFIVSKKASILDYPKPGLEPKVWQYDGAIQPKVKEQILNKLNKFVEAQGHTLQSIINKIYIVGSLTSYQYNKYTDLDIHSFINLQNMLGVFKGNEEELTELIDKNWRKTLNKAEAETIEGTQHPLEFYFEIPEDLDVAPSDGVYDLLNDKWIKEPRTIDIDFDVEKIYPEIINNAKNLAKELDINFGELKRNVTDAEMLQEMIDSLSEEQKELFKSKLTNKVEEIDEVISKLIKVEQGISDQRHENYAWDSPGNISFKYLQRFGYVNILKLLEKAVGSDKKFDTDDIENTQKVLNPIKSFKVVSFTYDRNSSEHEGRFRLIDPQSFDKDSFRRWTEWAGVKAPEGITFLVGYLVKEKKKALQTIRFNKELWSEKEAGKFWDKVKNKKGFERF